MLGLTTVGRTRTSSASLYQAWYHLDVLDDYAVGCESPQQVVLRPIKKPSCAFISVGTDLRQGHLCIDTSMGRTSQEFLEEINEGTSFILEVPHARLKFVKTVTREIKPGPILAWPFIRMASIRASFTSCMPCRHHTSPIYK